MMNLSTRDRETVAKLLALAGSTEHEGETVSAVKKADELIKSRGASWQDVLLVRPIRAEPQPSSWRRTADPEHVRIATDLLHRGRGIINDWERNFLLSILAYRELKPRQLETLSLISRKVSVAKDQVA
jgi:hypothetical protein